MALPVPSQPKPDAPFNGVEWQRWFRALKDILATSGSILYTALDFTGSNITSLATRKHVDLQALQGGQTGQYYHLTANQNTAIAGYDIVVTKTAAYIATATDGLILCDATAAGFTVTLPAVSGLTGKRYTILKTDVTANVVTLQGHAAENINGANTQTLSAQYKSYTIEGDGTQWWIVAAT